MRRGRAEREPRLTLLDTNVFIHFLKGDPGIVARLAKTPRSELAIPSIVVYELEYGTLRSKFPARRRNELEEGLKNIQHVPFDTNAAMTAARIRIELEKRGVQLALLIC